jgi:hypothetical protein
MTNNTFTKKYAGKCTDVLTGIYKCFTVKNVFYLPVISFELFNGHS